MVKDTVFQIASEITNFSFDKLKASVTPFDNLSLDNDEFLAVITLFEDEYSIEFDDYQLEDLNKIKDIIQAIKENIYIKVLQMNKMNSDFNFGEFPDEKEKNRKKYESKKKHHNKECEDNPERNSKQKFKKSKMRNYND